MTYIMLWLLFNSFLFIYLLFIYIIIIIKVAYSVMDVHVDLRV